MKIVCKSEKNAVAPWIVVGLLLLAVAAVFSQTLRFDFVNYDDDFFVYNNPHLAGGLTLAKIGWAMTTTYCSMWGPVTWFSYLLDCQLYGLDHAWGYHLTNVLLHAVTTLVLFWTLWRMTGDLWPSAVAAALFAIHPLHVESVAWIAERKGLLGGMFFVLTLAAYVRYVQRPFSWRNYLLMIVFFVLGIMSKPVLVTLPFLFLLLDYWPLGRIRRGAGDGGRGTGTPVASGQWLVASEKPQADSNPQSPIPNPPAPGLRQIILEKLPLLALAVASSASAPLTQGAAVVPFDVLPMPTRLANAVVSYAAYLIQFFWPAGLTPLYPHTGECPPVWQLASAGSLLAAISVAAIVFRRKCPQCFVGWFWFVGTLVPMIGLVQLGSHVRADRYTYVTQIGLTIAVIWSVAQIAAAWPRCRRACGATAVAVIAVMMGLAWQQTSYWRDSVTLWTHALECHPRSIIAHANLGVGLERKHDYAGAEREYRETIRLNPDAYDARNNLGWVLLQRGETAEAIKHFARVLDGNPKHILARNNLTVTLINCGRAAEAIPLLRETLEFYPNSADAANSLACILAERGNLGEAISYFRRALTASPNDARITCNLGKALYRQGKTAEAVELWRRAVTIQNGEDVWTINQLAWALATCPDPSIRNGKEAVELAAWAAKLSSERNPTILGTLAAAYAEAGRFADAVQTARKALQLAAKQKDQTPAKSLEAQLALYEAGKPFRENPAATAAPTRSEKKK